MDLQLAREMLRMGPVRQASSVVGLLSRLDVPTLLELLPIRLKEWNRFYHDIVVRQIAYGAAQDRGRTLLEILEHLDAMVLPQAIDEIGMSGDRTTVPPLMVMAEAGESQGRSAIVQIKAIESLGRLREPESIAVLRNLLETKKMWKWSNHRELRIAAAQALAKIDPRYAAQVMSDSGLRRVNSPLLRWTRPQHVRGCVNGGTNESFCGRVCQPLSVAPGANPASRFAS